MRYRWRGDGDCLRGDCFWDAGSPGGASFFYGGGFGLLKIVWIVVAAVFLYDISVDTGQFEIMKESVAAITPDRRLQLLLVAFCFGAFIEGCGGLWRAGGDCRRVHDRIGIPTVSGGGLEFDRQHRAGGVGCDRDVPMHTLAAVSALPESDLNAMIGRIPPFTAVIVPFWLVRTMVSWAETFEVLPAILVVGCRSRECNISGRTM